MSRIEDKLHSIIHIKWLLMLSTVPFMFICPLALTSVLTGFPYENLQNNTKIQQYRESFDEMLLADETIQIGITYSNISNVDDAENCDIYAAKLVKSNLEQKKLSEVLLLNFQKEFSGPANEVKNFELVTRSQLKLYPIVLTDNFYENQELSFNLINDFKISDSDRSAEGEAFLLYMINYNAFGSRDARCN